MMFPLAMTSFVAVGAFASTNGDDFLLLLALLTRASFPRVVVGQLLGMAILIALSLCGAAGLDLIDPSLVRWLGVVPIFIGVRELLRKVGGQAVAPAPEVSVASVGWLTVANGGDNLGVYVPLFGVQTLEERVLTVSIFLLMTLGICFLARAMTRFTRSSDRVQEVLGGAFPILLIGIGGYILLK